MTSEGIKGMLEGMIVAETSNVRRWKECIKHHVEDDRKDLHEMAHSIELAKEYRQALVDTLNAIKRLEDRES